MKHGGTKKSRLSVGTACAPRKGGTCVNRYNLIWYILIGNVVEVEVEEAGFRPFILHRQRHELLLQIKRNGGGVSVHGQEAAAGLVVGEEKALDSSYQKLAKMLSLQILVNCQTANFRRRIAFQPLFVDKPMLAETVKFSFIREIRH